MVRLKDKFVPICGAITGFSRTPVSLISEEGKVVVEAKIEDASDLVAEIEGMCRQDLFQDAVEALWFYEVVEPFAGPNLAV